MKFYVIVFALLGCLILGAVGGYYFCKSGIPAQLTDQQTTDKKECEAAQQITKDANDALQKSRDSISSQLDALRLQHPTTCVRVTGRADVSGAGNKYAAANGNGLSSDWLRAFAAQCESYRSEINVCVDFLAQERQVIQPAQ
jgi:hypothetical protein